MRIKKVRVNFRVSNTRVKVRVLIRVQNDEQGQDHPRVILGA